MAKPRGMAKAKSNGEQSPLLDALRFVALAQREEGEPYQTHVALKTINIEGRACNVAVTFDGTLAAGAFVDAGIEACPHTDLLIKAMTRISGAAASVTQTSQSLLTIKTENEKFKAHVPCISFDIMPNVNPDPPVTPINNNFILGLNKIAGLATETGSHVVTSSILVRRFSMVATDRNIMVEYWHGIDLPTFSLPKAAAIALVKCGKELQWFGFSQHTVTFFFSDGTWLRSQLYGGEWPSVDGILSLPSNPWPVPQSFFEGVRAVAPFHETGWITFKKGKLASHKEENVGAEYQVAGIPAGPVFNAKYLMMLESLAKTIDFVAAPGKAVFFGDNVRGVMIGILERPQPQPGDEIPF